MLDQTQGHALHDFFVFRAENTVLIEDYFEMNALKKKKLFVATT